MSGFGRAIKFLFDRVMALLGLLGLGWLLIAIGIWIKVKMPKAPVLYVQERIGRHGKRFKIHKFRTMYEEDEGPSVAYPDEGRVTPEGAMLRRTKLDELPELWDVLIGNMSFVGPRPDVPGYADKLEGEDRVVLEMRPGITGPATLKYKHEDEMIKEYVNRAKADGDPRTETEIALWYNDHVIYPDKVRINCEYYRNYSFFKDMKLILETVF